MATPPFAKVVAVLLAFSLFTQIARAEQPAKEMAAAAQAFLSSLTAEQRAKATYEFKDDERFNWHFVPRARNGLPFKEMSPAQRDLGGGLMRHGLSQEGYTKATNIITILEAVLKEMENGAARRDPELYYITIFGNPDLPPWGWRVEGHHVALNFCVTSNTLISVTPTFFGSNPAEVRQGPHKGLRTLGAEEDLARQLVASLNQDQRKSAVFATNAPRDIITGNARKATVLEPKGIAGDKLSPAQQGTLLAIIKEYVFRFRTEIAEQDLKKIQAAGWDKLHFAWAGPFERGSGGVYYRIQGPTFLIEYDNTQNNANHAHTVWRDLENDFGEDLLQKHYETSHKH